MFQPELEALDRPALARLQLDRMRHTLARVGGNAAWSRRLGGVRPEDVKGQEDWARLPFLTKDELRDAYPFTLACGGAEGYRRVHMSSGTTGNPILNPYTAADIEQWGEVMARCYVAAGVTRDDVIQITPSFGLFTGGFGFHYGAERLGAMIVPTGAGRTLAAAHADARPRRHRDAGPSPRIRCDSSRSPATRDSTSARCGCASRSSAPRCGPTSCARGSSASSRSRRSTSSA